MGKGTIVTGLDIGTHTMKALVVEERGGEWNVLSYMQIPSFGLRRGAVVNVDETTKNIQLLVSRIEHETGHRISSAFVNINGSHLRVEPSDGLISVSRADHIISQEDIDRVLQATRAINIPSNEEILDVFPKEFIIDDQKGIKQPLGLTGVRLQAKTLLLCYFQSYFINVTQAVLNAHIQIDDVVPSPLAAARAVLTPQQKEIGVALIDVGSATTSLAVFDEGELIHLAIFPLGSANITNDIAIGLRTQVSTAEDIKREHGTCVAGKETPKKKSSKISITSQRTGMDQDDEYKPQESLVPPFTTKNLVDIIEPRVAEILNLIQKELKSIGRQELLPGGVVLTGGGVVLPKFKEVVKEQLKLPCQIGVPLGIVGLHEDPGLATVAGLVLGGIDWYEAGNQGTSRVIKGVGSSFKKLLRIFMP